MLSTGKLKIFEVFVWLFPLLILCLGSCQPAPKFKGRLIIHNRNGLYSLSLSPGGGRIIESRIADRVTSASVSPNNQYLVYSKEKPGRVFADPVDAGETLLRDLVSGTERTLFAYEVSGLNWSPDSQKISYTHLHRLYVSSLTGESQLVYSEPSETYQTPGPGIRSATTVFATSSEGLWVSPDRLVFQSRENFPSVIGGGGLEPTTTTLAHLGKEIKLTAASRRWFVGSRCAVEPLVLFAQNAAHSSYQYNVQAPLFVARDFVTFEQTELKPLSYENANFMPRSCRLYSIIADRPAGVLSLKFTDPATLKTENGPTLSDNRYVLFSIVNPNEDTIALFYALAWDKFGLSIVDLKSGGESKLLTSESGSDSTLLMRDLKLLAWLNQ